GNHRLTRPIEGTQIPATVQAVLAARIDRLSPDEKRLLQSAAVVGKDVPFALLQAIADQSEEELRRGLTRLQAAEFLYEISLFPDLEYTFKHALTHEVAYGSVLQERRRELHARIVEAIERLYPDRLAEQIERIAHHSSRAELWEKAVEYFHQAGAKSAARSANREAIACFEQALDALKHLPESRRTLERAINIRVDLGPALTATSNFSAPKVEENYTRARELCERFGETPQLFPVLWGLARMHDHRGELRVGRGFGEQLLNLAERAQDPALLLEAHHELWANLFALGELVSAHSHMEQGIALYDPQKHRHHAFRYGGHDPGVCGRYQAAEALWLLGYPDQALRRSQNSLTLARELSHATTMSVALSWAAWFDQVRGEKQSLQARIHEGAALATEQGFLRWRAHATFLQGWLLVEEGHAKTGIAQMFEIFAIRGPLRFHIRRAALLGEAYRKSRQIVDGLNVVNDAIASTRQ